MSSAASSSHPSVGDLSVLVFGPQARSAGTDRLRLSAIEFPITAGKLISKIAETYPDLASSLNVSRIAVNHEFATAGCPIQRGDEVALVGLISGG
ncbi:MoaD/ThiS family protein [Allorhodopirellula solitaria]|uniref:ThiS family protein n=1 Tax=Allorhodopirellula solitaria TaxID=2527987 RepID=A0A5C5XQS6_9BACT|nr:MoaD/ThiS family protein [Allorhodopirellula solitaria]TWT64851.1 ThiS family protein [Allorhodopirellula solitaria]